MLKSLVRAERRDESEALAGPPADLRPRSDWGTELRPTEPLGGEGTLEPQHRRILTGRAGDGEQSQISL